MLLHHSSLIVCGCLPQLNQTAYILPLPNCPLIILTVSERPYLILRKPEEKFSKLWNDKLIGTFEKGG